MDWWLGILVVVGYAVLRLAVPFGIMALFVHEVRRLDIKWHPVALTGGGE